MQISLHADYAFRTLMYLAVCEPEKSSIGEIAKAYDISANHLTKVVRELGKFGFIDTLRGKGGGIKLAKLPSEINVGDVFRKMEPSLVMVECFDIKTNRCVITASCGLSELIRHALAGFMQVLDEKSLQSLIDASPNVHTLLKIARR